ncbi:MAG: SpoIID/LytB domain-containing protein [Clostridiales bacterium]|nr:SpoIID/LytB domain-containing protein [Clostridiales bacterium]
MNNAIKFLALLIGTSLSLPTTRAADIPDELPIPQYECSATITQGAESYDIEDYVFGVLLGEVPYTFEHDALCAQAVAARTYCLHCFESGAKISTAFDTLDALSVRYGDEYAMRSEAAVRAAVEATAGQILVTESVEPILAVWHASSHGNTESSANVWGGSLDYLVPVESFEPVENIESTAEFTLADVKKKLADAGYRYNMCDSVEMTFDSAGRCETLTLGNVTLTGLKTRTIFGLRSTDFTVKIDDGKLHFDVLGYGHGVGMSQLGANEMAKRGYSWREILAHYYPGSELCKILRENFEKT